VRPIAFIQRIRQVRAALRTRADAMRPGRYRVTDRWAARLGCQHPPWLLRDTTTGRGKFVKRFVKAWIQSVMGVIRVRTDTDPPPGFSGFRGDLLFVTRNGQSKLFDYAQRRVLTFGASGTQVGHNADRSWFQPYLPSPRVFARSEDPPWTLEEFVPGKPATEVEGPERDNAIEWVFSSHIAHVESLIPTPESLSLAELFSKVGRTPEFNVVLSRIHGRIGREPLTLPVVPSHGDICFKNLIRANDSWIVLDWEYAGPHSAIYDALNWMLVEAADHDDFTYLRRYLAGTYDASMSRLCRLAGFNRLPPRRSDLFGYFMLERLVRRYAHRPELERRRVAARYARIIEYVRQTGRQ
jgi:hypothetical protein